MVLWKFTTQASQSHQLFNRPATFQSQHLNHSLLLSWPRQPPSETHRRHPSYCCSHVAHAVPFSLTARKMNETGEWWFVVCGNRYFGAPKAHEKHLTKEGTDSKNTRCCLRDIQSLSWKLKQSLALLADFHQATARLETALDFTYHSFVSEKFETNLAQHYSGLSTVLFPLWFSRTWQHLLWPTKLSSDREVIFYKDSDIKVAAKSQRQVDVCWRTGVKWTQEITFHTLTGPFLLLWYSVIYLLCSNILPS